MRIIEEIAKKHNLSAEQIEKLKKMIQERKSLRSQVVSSMGGKLGHILVDFAYFTSQNRRIYLIANGDEAVVEAYEEWHKHFLRGN